MLMADIRYQHIVTQAWTFTVTIWENSHCSSFTRTMSFLIKSGWISKYSLCTFTFWSTYISHSIL
jgi:hypothetical protein